jgi:hypothetical protein
VFVFDFADDPFLACDFAADFRDCLSAELLPEDTTRFADSSAEGRGTRDEFSCAPVGEASPDDEALRPPVRDL